MQASGVANLVKKVYNGGGINPYTLTARLGPRDLAHYKMIRSLIHLLGVLHKETRRGDQARSWSVRIGIDMTIVTD